jgi:hypothetical protein
LAGELTDKVVEFEIYKHKSPDQLSRPLLEQLVGLNNRAAIEKLVLLDPAAIEALLSISSANLVALASQLAPADLNVVAHYLPLLNQEQKNAFVSRLLSTPSLVTQLQDKEVQKAIGSNQELDAALGFLATPRDALSILGDVVSLLSGKVALRLFLYKYGGGQSTVIGLVGLLLLLIVLRLIWALIAWLVRPVTVLLGR